MKTYNKGSRAIQEKWRKVRENYRENNPSTCKECNEILPYVKRRNKFCSQSCSATYNNKQRSAEFYKEHGKKLKESGFKPTGTLGLRSGYYKECTNNDCNNEMYVTSSNEDRKYCTHECMMNCDQYKELKSDILSDQYTEGRDVVGGKTSWYTVDTLQGDCRVQGTYEVRCCKILDDMTCTGDINDWEYTNDRITYFDEIQNKERTYLLDFKLFHTDGSFSYLEVKGFMRRNDPFKWRAVINKGYKFNVWFGEDLDFFEKLYNT